MKKYLDQIFYEGLGKTIYLPIEKLINKINNSLFKKRLIIFTKIIYFVVALTIAICLFFYKL
ncbi:MAG: hypothetical protein E7163_01795 [Firmicutes bacterium]|nr:hypothetical protein [Bacillota bacterium]